MYFWSAPLFEKAFLDSKFRPIPVREVSVTAAKRAFNHSFMGKLRRELTIKGKLRLATLWAWPIPGVAKELERMMSREPGTVLPAHGYPFVAVNLQQLLSTLDEEVTRVVLMGETVDKSGELRRYKVSLHISVINEQRLDGEYSPL